jgi:hypothetical protein
MRVVVVVMGLAAALAACGGPRAEPELASGPQQAASRASCVGMDTTFRATFSGPVYTACGVTREARESGRSPRTDFDPPRGGASCFRAIIEVVVDEKGTPQPETARIVRTTDTRFARAAIDGLRRRRYTPASLNGQPVAQVVQVDDGMETRTVVVRASPGGGPPVAPPPVMSGRMSC